MNRTQQCVGILFCVIVLVSCLIRLAYLRREQLQAARESSKVYGAYSECQISQRSMELIRAIEPDTSAISIDATRYVVNGRKFWLTSKKDPDGVDPFTATWDASTGELSTILRNRPQTSALAYVVTTPEQALKEMRRWIARVQRVTHINVTDTVSSVTFRDDSWVGVWHNKNAGCNIVLDRGGNVWLLSQWKSAPKVRRLHT